MVEKTQIAEKPKDNIKVDIRDVYTETTKTVKEHTVNWVKRYGYWAMIAVLFVLSMLMSLITIGDVYRRTSLNESEILEKYIEAGHIMSDSDMVIIRDLITEAYSKNEIISYTDYDKFLETVKSYNYSLNDGSFVRFDSLAFYLFTKEKQQFINFAEMEEWRVILISMNGVIGVLVTITFMQTGIQDAFATSLIRKKKDKLYETSSNAAKHRLKAESYFSKLHIKQLESVRRTELSICGLMYEDYFEEDGRYKNGQYPKPIQAMLNKVLKIKVKQLSFDMLATRVSNNSDSTKLVTVKTYTRKTAAKSIALKTLIVVFFTFVSVSLIVSAQSTWQIFMNVISTVLMFAAGILEYLNAYSFIVEDFAETLDVKDRHLESFISYCENEEKEEKIRIEKEEKLLSEQEQLKQKLEAEQAKVLKDMQAEKAKGELKYGT